MEGILVKYLRMDPAKEVLGDIVAQLQLGNYEDSLEGLVKKWRFLQSQQTALLDGVLCHPVAVQFPPRVAFRIALVKLLLSHLEDVEDLIAKKESSRFPEGGEVSPWEEEGIVLERLLELYLEWGAEEAAARNTDDMSVGKDENARFFASYTLQTPAAIAAPIVSFAVTTQFTNVGFALWPSAFVSVDLLATLMSPAATDTPHLRELKEALGMSTVGKESKAPLVVELGAGVGLTPIVLDRVLPAPPRCIVTDYQPAILDNCAENCARNSVPHTMITTKSTKEEIEACHTGLALLDWTETTEKYDMLHALSPDILLAADCIYDRTVLEGLNDTIRYALTGHTSTSASPVKRPTCRAVIIVQSHRNDETQKELHHMLAKYAKVNSYRYVPADNKSTSWMLRPMKQSWLESVASPGSANDEPPNEIIPLISTGRYRVDMHELLHVHIVTAASPAKVGSPQPTA